MINGHGDDIYQYSGLLTNFSSNISQHADHTLLKAHLASRLDVIANYPEPEPWSLERRLARQHGVPTDCVLVTNGATEAIYLLAQAYAHLPYRVVQPTFSEYADACRLFGLCHGDGGLLWLCNPNNPDGRITDIDTLGHYALLVVDQAYELYTRHPLLSPREAVERGNVAQLHSMTKDYAVPGLRLGYVVAAEEIIGRLRAVLRPWSVNALAIEAGHFLLDHPELRVSPDLGEARRLWQALTAVDGISVEPTETTFMLCRSERCKARWLKDRLARHHGLLIRDASNFIGLDDHCFRVASQLPQENDTLVKAIVETTAQNSQ